MRLESPLGSWRSPNQTTPIVSVQTSMPIKVTEIPLATWFRHAFPGRRRACLVLGARPGGSQSSTRRAFGRRACLVFGGSRSTTWPLRCCCEARPGGCQAVFFSTGAMPCFRVGRKKIENVASRRIALLLVYEWRYSESLLCTTFLLCVAVTPTVTAR